MYEKTETKPLKEIAESMKEIAESLKEFTESVDKTAEPVEKITDYYAKRWYDLGFRFAINYFYQIMPEPSDKSFDWETFKTFDRETFKNFVADKLVKGIDEKYFEKFPFIEGSYPSGQCPGDSPGTCIQCSDVAIKPLKPRKKTRPEEG